MKELIILRHAKSNRSYGVEDIHRPLSVEGIERIKKVSQKKHDFFEKADVIISSSANRAFHTAMIMMQELNLPQEKLIIDKKNARILTLLTEKITCLLARKIIKKPEIIGIHMDKDIHGNEDKIKDKDICYA